MFKRLSNNKGVALMITLAVLLVIVALANVMLGTMLSQARLTRHQVSRIQAYYAAMGAINYTYQKLLLNDDPVNWPQPATMGVVSYNITFCQSAPCNVINTDFPASIERVTVTVTRPNIISAAVNYTPTPSTPF